MVEGIGGSWYWGKDEYRLGEVAEFGHSSYQEVQTGKLFFKKTSY